jgi:UMP-CMP kinase
LLRGGNDETTRQTRVSRRRRDNNPRESSGRIDDNVESIKKRFTTFRDTSFPVIEHYQKEGKVNKVVCDQKSVDEVYKEVREMFVGL